MKDCLPVAPVESPTKRNGLNHTLAKKDGNTAACHQNRFLDAAAELFVLGSVINYPSIFVECGGLLSPDYFATQQGRAIFDAVVSINVRNEPLNVMTVTRELDSVNALSAVGGFPALSGLDGINSISAVQHEIERLSELGLKREVVRIGKELAELGNVAEPLEQFEMLAARVDLLREKTQGAFDVEALLAPRRAHSKNPPPEAAIVWKLGDAPIASSGNILAVQAKLKAGKSAFVSALIASTIDASADCFGLSSANPNCDILLHFDTEQSPHDHHVGYTRTLRRAGWQDDPFWLESYYITDLTLKQRLEVIRWKVRHVLRTGRKLLAVVIDGVADLCMDVNDPAESNALVDEMHRLAVTGKTVVVCVIHENTGSDIGKTRGHLGSQLERKAETNLRLEKDADGVTVIFADRARHAHIPKERGSRFRWSEEECMHVSCESAQVRKETAKAIEHRMLADDIFKDIPPKIGLAWREIMNRIRDMEELKESGARKRLAALVASGSVNRSKQRYYKGN